MMKLEDAITAMRAEMEQAMLDRLGPGDTPDFYERMADQFVAIGERYLRELTQPEAPPVDRVALAQGWISARAEQRKKRKAKKGK